MISVRTGCPWLYEQRRFQEAAVKFTSASVVHDELLTGCPSACGCSKLSLVLVKSSLGTVLQNYFATTKK